MYRRHSLRRTAGSPEAGRGSGLARTPLAVACLIATALGVAACNGAAPPPGSGGLGTIAPTSPAPQSSAATPSSSDTGGGAPGGEDCYTYDAQVLLKNYAAGVHVIRPDHGEEIIRVHGGPGDVVGDKALAVATRFTKVCYIGRGNSLGSPTYVFEYWREPSGLVHPNEPTDLWSDCVDYAPADLQVGPNPDGPGFAVRAGGLVLHLFATEADANAARAVLSLEGQLCYLRNHAPAPVDAPADITFTHNSGD